MVGRTDGFDDIIYNKLFIYYLTLTWSDFIAEGLTIEKTEQPETELNTLNTLTEDKWSSNTNGSYNIITDQKCRTAPFILISSHIG